MSTSLVPGGGPVAGAVAVVAVPTQDPAPPPGEGPEFGKASPVALVVILLLGIATVLLIRNMTKRIRRLPASFDDPPAAGGAPDAPGSGPEPDPADPQPDPAPSGELDKPPAKDRSV